MATEILIEKNLQNYSMSKNQRIRFIAGERAEKIGYNKKNRSPEDRNGKDKVYADCVHAVSVNIFMNTVD